MIKNKCLAGDFSCLNFRFSVFYANFENQTFIKKTMLLRILGYLCQLCFIIGLYYGLKSQEAFLQYTVCILAILILLQRIFIDLFWKKENT